MIGSFGWTEGLIILAIVIVIFGVGKLGDVGGALGKSVREFRKAASEPDEAETSVSESSAEEGESTASTEPKSN